MLKLCGFAASNYYNKVKLALLEKGVPFEEVEVWPSDSAEFLSKSPMGRIPYLESGALVVAESQAIIEYVEALHPDKPLIPTDAAAAAKVRELVQFTELYLEWEARRIYSAAFFGGTADAALRERTHRNLVKAVAALRRLTSFSPFAVGEQFTLADCVLAVHLPVVGRATRLIYDEDLVADPVIKEYLGRIAARPAMQRVLADFKAGAALMAERNYRPPNAVQAEGA